MRTFLLGVLVTCFSVAGADAATSKTAANTKPSSGMSRDACQNLAQSRGMLLRSAQRKKFIEKCQAGTQR
jgi:hypothetical protein